METKLLNQQGKEVGTVELNDSVFNVEVNKGLIHRALVYQLANARQVVAHTKTRSDRRGSTRKLYKQKGTGKARAGSSRSPIRKKGGVAFGPRNNVNFTLSMNKKERRLALLSLLTMKVQSNNLIILDKIDLKEIKTKDMLDIVNSIPFEKNILLAIASKNELIEKSSSNLVNIKTILADYLNISDLLKYKTLVLLKDSLEKLNTLK
ncbi:MAG: 50S ribosomal protein L4 [Candidatus Gracilibacteria bacterium]|nr:50S ribosomal protein L4 [Candidatus Gracilibacteria bacterium]